MAARLCGNLETIVVNVSFAPADLPMTIMSCLAIASINQGMNTTRETDLRRREDVYPIFETALLFYACSVRETDTA
jgi:hypothetical protein